MNFSNMTSAHLIFIPAVLLIGIVIGWVLDGLFDTRPWIMLGLMFLAFFGACLQVVRSNKAG